MQGELRPCVIGRPSRTNVLFLGDSHAEPFYTPISRPAGRATAFTFLTYGGCPPLPDTNMALPGSRCRDFLEAAWAQAESGDYQEVVLSAFWPIYLESYRPGSDNNHLLCFEQGGSCRIERDPAQYGRAVAAAFERLATRIRALRARGIEVTPAGTDALCRYRHSARIGAASLSRDRTGRAATDRGRPRSGRLRPRREPFWKRLPRQAARS
ncbi:MAG: SGNH hydrolase domain-containing protein [Candidatus Kaistia colombiensis]|nr:MAG: SGNH hydrolase domain-containing protein [Kaistia sp.]